MHAPARTSSASTAEEERSGGGGQKHGGTGLGLAIARTIVVAHGGRLWGSNNDRGGATFYIALPAAS